MLRVANWDRALIAVAEQFKGTPFEWGKTDCATVTATCINAMYPEPVLNVLIGSVRDASLLGDPDTVESILSDSRAVSVAPGMATCGDLVVTDGGDPDGLPAFGVMLRGRRMITSSRERGVCVVNIKGASEPKVYRMPQ